MNNIQVMLNIYLKNGEENKRLVADEQSSSSLIEVIISNNLKMLGLDGYYPHNSIISIVSFYWRLGWTLSPLADPTSNEVHFVSKDDKRAIRVSSPVNDWTNKFIKDLTSSAQWTRAKQIADEAKSLSEDLVLLLEEENDLLPPRKEYLISKGHAKMAWEYYGMKSIADKIQALNKKETLSIDELVYMRNLEETLERLRENIASRSVESYKSSSEAWSRLRRKNRQSIGKRQREVNKIVKKSRKNLMFKNWEVTGAFTMNLPEDEISKTIVQREVREDVKNLIELSQVGRMVLVQIADKLLTDVGDGDLSEVTVTSDEIVRSSMLSGVKVNLDADDFKNDKGAIRLPFNLEQREVNRNELVRGSNET